MNNAKISIYIIISDIRKEPGADSVPTPAAHTTSPLDDALHGITKRDTEAVDVADWLDVAENELVILVDQEVLGDFICEEDKVTLGEADMDAALVPVTLDVIF